MEKEKIQENLEKYIDNNSKITKKNIKYKLFILWALGLPTGFLGININITIPLISIFIFVMTIWSIFILKCSDNNLQIIFKGIYLLMISIIFLIASYKIFSLNRIIQAKEIIIFIVLYILSIIIYNLFIIRSMFNNVYSRKKNNTLFVFGASIFGIIIGRSMIGNMNNDLAIFIAGSISILIAFVFGLGTKDILIYYLIKKYSL